jgi:hypothetical protein
MGNQFVFRVQQRFGVALEPNAIAVKLLKVSDRLANAFAGKSVQRPEPPQISAALRPQITARNPIALFCLSAPIRDRCTFRQSPSQRARKSPGAEVVGLLSPASCRWWRRGDKGQPVWVWMLGVSCREYIKKGSFFDRAIFPPSLMFPRPQSPAEPIFFPSASNRLKDPLF